MRKVRCKFVCTSVENGVVALDARYDPNKSEEDLSFATATPWGHMQFGCDNPAALEQFVPGREYYIDIVQIEPAAPADPA